VTHGGARAAPPESARERGAAAEDAACAHLEAHGLVLEARNFRSRLGEIDLVFDDHGTCVFVEVRQRGSARFGGAAASITVAKRRKLEATARLYLVRDRRDRPCRFDVVLLDGRDDLEWIRDAFGT
jgi:putative endonuclease